ncbi:MAG: hypothetical protein PHU25_15145 [Deltaproteobacteria bacterium]|nr:hypothetical protein [Deltaproteobacteria bacterium]
MASRIRVVEPGLVYSATQRCNDRRFLFRPDHNPANPLLHIDCPSEALDSASPVIPVPSTINVIGASAARSLALHPLNLHWLEGNVNHLHDGFSTTPEQIGNVAPFFRDFLSNVARGINRILERTNHVFGGRYHMEPCLDLPSAEQQLVYALTNAVKDGLVERVSESPFFSTYRHLAFGEPLAFWRIDWDAYWRAGGPRKKSHKPKDYLRWDTLELTPLPGWENLTISQRQTRVRRLVRDVEEEVADRRRAEGCIAVGVPRLYALSPFERPKRPPDDDPQPLCHASDAESRREFKRQWREIMAEYRKASIDYRAGYHEREFPEGTYRPPIVTIYTSSRL